MKKENLILRFLGLITLAIGVYWFWKADFTLTSIYGVPLPLQFVLMTVGLFTVVAPAPFLSVVSVFLPDGLRERVEKFSNTYLNGDKISQIVFTSKDEGQVLADKLNRAVLFSKRRFYVGVTITLILLPLLIFYFIKVAEHKKENLVRQSDALIEALQANRLSFSSADRFRAVLRNTNDIKANPGGSSTSRIYYLLEQLYGDDVNSEEIFRSKLSAIYEKEIKAPLDSNDLDFKKLRPPASDTDSKDAREALYILLGIICNLEGRNGRLMVPYLYGRLALNQLSSQPSISYHVSGWNYSGLFKSTLTHRIQPDSKLVKAAFPNGVSSKWSLAAKALAQYDDYVKHDSSQLALVRKLNNVVDIHLPLIYFLRVDQEQFQPETEAEYRILKVRAEDLSVLFNRLHSDLDKTKLFLSDAVIDTTAAQLYSLEGEVNAKEKTARSRDFKWNEEQRKRALEKIKHAYKPDSSASKDTFSYDNRKTAFLSWLWDDPETKQRLQEIVK